MRHTYMHASVARASWTMAAPLRPPTGHWGACIPEAGATNALNQPRRWAARPPRGKRRGAARERCDAASFFSVGQSSVCWSSFFFFFNRGECSCEWRGLVALTACGAPTHERPTCAPKRRHSFIHSYRIDAAGRWTAGLFAAVFSHRDHHLSICRLAREGVLRRASPRPPRHGDVRCPPRHGESGRRRRRSAPRARPPPPRGAARGHRKGACARVRGGRPAGRPAAEQPSCVAGAAASRGRLWCTTRQLWGVVGLGIARPRCVPPADPSSDTKVLRTPRAPSDAL